MVGLPPAMTPMRSARGRAVAGEREGAVAVIVERRSPGAGGVFAAASSGAGAIPPSTRAPIALGSARSDEDRILADDDPVPRPLCAATSRIIGGLLSIDGRIDPGVEARRRGARRRRRANRRRRRGARSVPARRRLPRRRARISAAKRSARGSRRPCAARAARAIAGPPFGEPGAMGPHSARVSGSPFVGEPVLESRAPDGGVSASRSSRASASECDGSFYSAPAGRARRRRDGESRQRREPRKSGSTNHRPAQERPRNSATTAPALASGGHSALPYQRRARRAWLTFRAASWDRSPSPALRTARFRQFLLRPWPLSHALKMIAMQFPRHASSGPRTPLPQGGSRNSQGRAKNFTPTTAEFCRGRSILRKSAGAGSPRTRRL